MDNKTCFMFGHANCPDRILSKLEQSIEDCYSKHNIRSFYMGNRGQFDHLAATAVKRAKLRHKDIRLYLLLAYHPAERAVDLSPGFDGSYYPPLENVPRQFAIVQANQYMVDTVDCVICYAQHIGNTNNLLKYARQRQRKGAFHIENVAENT